MSVQIFGEYYYAILDTRSSSIPSDASMELSPQLPEPGTPVVVKLAGAKKSSQSLKYQSLAHISPPNEQWNRVVVQTQTFRRISKSP